MFIKRSLHLLLKFRDMPVYSVMRIAVFMIILLHDFKLDQTYFLESVKKLLLIKMNTICSMRFILAIKIILRHFNTLIFLLSQKQLERLMLFYSTNER